MNHPDIGDAHRQVKVDPPEGKLIRDVLSGARREKGAALRQKAALRAEDFRSICCKLARSRGENAARDRALLALGFTAALVQFLM